MGAFYGSILVRTENSGEVQKALNEVAKALNCKFLVGPPVNGWISIFPDNSGQSDTPSVETAKRLPNDIFHLIVHDDDIFAYYFFRGGRLVDHYNSCPDYFKEVSTEEKQKCQGRPELFQDLLGNLQGGLGIVDIEKQQLIKKLAVNRKMETIDPFAGDSKGVMAHACIKHFLENPQVREKLGVDASSHAAIIQDPKAVEKLLANVQQKIKSMLEKVRQGMSRTFETQEQVFDVRFSPSGEQLFIASKGMRVFDWNKVLSADKDTPAPEFSVDAPVADEADPNSRPLAYSVHFDTKRNILLSSCLAGVIQYLNVKNGQSGILLKLPDEVSVWQLELTDDRNALCCHCTTRSTLENRNKREDFLQVWNYPALCKAVGLA